MFPFHCENGSCRAVPFHSSNWNLSNVERKIDGNKEEIRGKAKVNSGYGKTKK